MKLRARLMVLSISMVALIVTVLFGLHLDSLTRNWLDSALERSNGAGHEIQRDIVARIGDSAPSPPGETIDETKKAWTQVVATDQSLTDAMVEQAARPAASIVEINVIGEQGHVIASSIPSRLGQTAPHREDLEAVRDSGFLGRLKAIVKSRNDYEIRVPLGMMGVPEPTPPVFQIQVLVSSILLWDKVKPELLSTAYVSLFALLAAAGLAAISAHLALLPLRRIGRAVDTLAIGKPLGLSLPAENGEDREVAAIEYKLGLIGEQMEGARRDADQIRSFGKLARSVAHEIKNPLNAISLRLETLRMRITPEVPEAEAEIDLVSNEVQRLDRVVRTFLDLNRPMELEVGNFDAGELASSVMETMRPVAQQANVQLSVSKPGAALRVEADQGLLQQGLINVVNNAIQAIASTGEHGRVQIAVSGQNNNCSIAVTDNGPGMPENIQERIFEPYFSTKASGSGVGLAVTRRALELHGGDIHVKSSPGEGTTMVLSFPVRARSRV
ncbi:MAG TPA: HAMP domain-containing sensor histidine kinase [Bryobacteraceae bacterium]|jgi:signal transduction histidine kinase